MRFSASSIFSFYILTGRPFNVWDDLWCRSEEKIGLETWHELRVSRTAKSGILQVDSQRPMEGIAEVLWFFFVAYSCNMSAERWRNSLTLYTDKFCGAAYLQIWQMQSNILFCKLHLPQSRNVCLINSSIHLQRYHFKHIKLGFALLIYHHVTSQDKNKIQFLQYVIKKNLYYSGQKCLFRHPGVFLHLLICVEASFPFVYRCIMHIPVGGSRFYELSFTLRCWMFFLTISTHAFFIRSRDGWWLVWSVHSKMNPIMQCVFFLYWCLNFDSVYKCPFHI